MNRKQAIVAPLMAAWLLLIGGLSLGSAAPGTPAAGTPAAGTPVAGTGAIVGLVTIEGTQRPVEGVYITVGYKGIKLAAITGKDGRYRVERVPVGEPADVFGFHDGGYRYHNSSYDDHLKIVLTAGQTYTYNFSVKLLNDPAGEPAVSDPAVAPARVRAGDTVTFELTAKGGKGGLSDEVLAASPALGRLALLTPIGGDRFRGALTIPLGTKAGDYPFAFFAPSNDCYVNHVFPMLTVHVDAA